MKDEKSFLRIVFAWQDSWACQGGEANRRVLFFSGEQELYTLYHYDNIVELANIRLWLDSIVKNDKKEFSFVFNQEDENSRVVLRHEWEEGSEEEKDFFKKRSRLWMKTPVEEYCFVEPTAYLLESMYLPLMEFIATRCRAANDELKGWNVNLLQYYNLCKAYLVEEKLYGIVFPGKERPWIGDVLVLSPEAGDFLWGDEGECGHIDYGIKLRNGKRIDISPIRERLKKWMFYRYENPDAFDEESENYSEQRLHYLKEGLVLAKVLRKMLPLEVDLYYDGGIVDFLPEEEKKRLCHLQSSGTRNGYSWENWYYYPYVTLLDKQEDICRKAVPEISDDLESEEESFEFTPDEWEAFIKYHYDKIQKEKSNHKMSDNV